MLQVRDLFKSYGTAAVLDGVSLTVAQGEIMGLAGPNGAGKTTLLKCILGVVRPDSGGIQVRDVNARCDPLKARRLIGYAPSETALYHGLRADELLDFATRFHPERDLAFGRTLLDDLGVPRRRRIRQLSHGMKRKVLLAQVLATRAPLMILDEPMEAFDPDARRIAVDLLRTSAQAGHAVLCASHDLANTQALCDAVAFLSRGRIVREGSMHDVTRETARIIHITLKAPREANTLPARPGWSWSGDGLHWTLVHDDEPSEALTHLADVPIATLRSGAQSLDEVFASLYRDGSGEP